ncbi:LPS translocon maturation chaperone LptM [Acinetobacter soli]|uniref:LPS translocon maturation chaperone LptM n=1 Tax=Acinetobacter soli TaxID=487316 RepID=UPI00124F8320|nr:lipoprotein [Acinetobacter soli]
MRRFICYTSLLTMSLAMLGCGQTGALHLPSDPNYDKRAKYLLYSQPQSDKTSKDKTSKDKTSTPDHSASSQPVPSSP